VLNTSIGKNFFQFVNAYRVEEVKRMLVDPKNLYSIEAIGYECGFSSKSSFYKEFKRITGMTPAEYKKVFPLKLILQLAVLTFEKTTFLNYRNCIIAT
jgi:AraC-like DNA-binding protein